MPSQTPSQTIGPYFHMGIPRDVENDLLEAGTRGERICLRGQVFDGEGKPVPDALIEIWQADAGGHFDHPADPDQSQADPHFRGFGRCNTLDEGRFSFRTILPGPVAGPDGQLQAPHIDVRVFARGMLIHAVTRLYFAGEPANEADAVLASVDEARRQTLLAIPEDSRDLPTFRFDIHLQGDRETVFFEP